MFGFRLQGGKHFQKFERFFSEGGGQGQEGKFRGPLALSRAKPVSREGSMGVALGLH